MWHKKTSQKVFEENISSQMSPTPQYNLSVYNLIKEIFMITQSRPTAVGLKWLSGETCNSLGVKGDFFLSL